jgi:DNA-directed RNA polymerase specialized sigma24 family protein
MNKEQIISAFVSDPDYRKICGQIGGAYADDLYQELAITILELPDSKLQRISETCIKCFYWKLAKHQYCSRNSAFHKKYRKGDQIVKDHASDIIMVSQSSDLDPELMEKVERAVSEVYWYDSGILSLYAEKGTLKEVSQCTGIPLKSVYDTVANTRKIIKKKIRKYE